MLIKRNDTIYLGGGWGPGCDFHTGELLFQIFFKLFLYFKAMYLENVVNATPISTFLCIFSTLMLLLKKTYHENKEKRMTMSSGHDLKSTFFWMFFVDSFSQRWSPRRPPKKTGARVSMLCLESQTSPRGLHSLPATPPHLNNEESISGSPCVGAGLARMVSQC